MNATSGLAPPTLPKELSFDAQAAHGCPASGILRTVTLAFIVRQA